jgi:hypothetical protein
MAKTAPTGDRPPETKDETPPAKPVAIFRYGHVSAAVFANKVKSKSGGTADAYSVSVRRSYRAEDGEWGSSHSLRPADLLPAALALQKCYEFVAEADAPDDEKRQ